MFKVLSIGLRVKLASYLPVYLPQGGLSPARETGRHLVIALSPYRFISSSLHRPFTSPQHCQVLRTLTGFPAPTCQRWRSHPDSVRSRMRSPISLLFYLSILRPLRPFQLFNSSTLRASSIEHRTSSRALRYSLRFAQPTRGAEGLIPTLSTLRPLRPL